LLGGSGLRAEVSILFDAQPETASTISTDKALKALVMSRVDIIMRRVASHRG
jgi:hypothetical protein